MTTTTWRQGIDRIIQQKEIKVYDRELLNSICTDLNKRKIKYEIFNTSTDWTIKIK